MMHFNNQYIITAILYLIVATIHFNANARINDIKIENNSRISKETILAYLNVNVGQNANSENIDKSIKSLYQTGFFSDVKIIESDDKLIVKVVENPLINQIGFDGNKHIEDTDLTNELSMKINSVFSPYKLQADLNRLISLYHKSGRYSVVIEPKTIKLDQNRINLVYEIKEGKEALIKKINFIGNSAFSSSTLSENLASKEYRFYRFFSNAAIFDIDKLEFDKELLRRYYLNYGYADFKIQSVASELSIDKEGFLITFLISEGQLYKFGDFVIDNQLKKFESEVLKKFIKVKKDQKFNKELIDKSVDAISNYLGDNGYPFVEVEPVVTTDPNTSLASVKFIIKESYKVYIHNINIKNNTRTLDKVIRREFRVSENDPYNITKIQRSKQRIENLGYFNKVEFKNKKTRDLDKIDIDVDVEETSTGNVNFAGGYNTSTGILGQITFTENNFLGRGQQVQVGTTVAQKERNATFSFTEPYFLDKDLSAGFDLFANDRDFKSLSSFKSKNLGFGLRLGYEITENLSHGLRYTLKKERVTDISPNASIYIKEQQGRQFASLIGHTFTYDKLDSRLQPTQGYLLKLEQDLAGLGGTTKYIASKGLAAGFYPIYKNDVIFKIIGRVGHIAAYGGKQIKLNDRFYIGPEYIRGFDVAGVGARDKITNDALGGNIYYTSTTEIIFPVGLPNEVGLKAAFFHDLGALYHIDEKIRRNNIFDTKSLRASVGMSLIWKSPLGTISLNYGIPYKKEKFDDVKRFYVDFGTSF